MGCLEACSSACSDATAPIVAKHSSRTNDMETIEYATFRNDTVTFEESVYLAFIHYKHVRKFVLQRFLIFEWNISLIDVLIDVKNLSGNTTINGVIQNVMISSLLCDAICQSLSFYSRFQFAFEKSLRMFVCKFGMFVAKFQCLF